MSLANSGTRRKSHHAHTSTAISRKFFPSNEIRFSVTFVRIRFRIRKVSSFGGSSFRDPLFPCWGHVNHMARVIDHARQSNYRVREIQTLHAHQFIVTLERLGNGVSFPSVFVRNVFKFILLNAPLTSTRTKDRVVELI